jgi:hypothetical protein
MPRFEQRFELGTAAAGLALQEMFGRQKPWIKKNSPSTLLFQEIPLFFE